MTVKHLFRLVFLICLYGCSDNSDNRMDGFGQKQFGLYIENGPRQGFQYFNSTSHYNYFNYTMTITNDSMIPAHLEINFSEIGEVLSQLQIKSIFAAQTLDS